MTISEKSPASYNSALCADCVGYAVGSQVILRRVSFSVAPGEFIALFGPNGGGKTTLMHLMLGFIKPSQGLISMLGQPVRGVQCGVGWVPQHFRPDPLFPISVYEVVAMGVMYEKHPHDKVRKSLRLVDMESMEHVPFGGLSGGQAQRVLLARALIAEPPLLFLDEPTASLDPHAREIIYRLLAQLKGTTTIVMVTHDFQGALTLADRLLYVNQIVQEHRKEQLCEHTQRGLYHREIG